MAMIILKLAAKSVLIAWLIWAITFSIIYGAISRIQGGNLLSPDLPLEWWYMPATLLGCWTVMTVIASTCLTGQAKHLALLFGGLAASCIGFGILGSFTSGHEMEVLVSYVETIAIGVVLVMGTGWTFETARRRQLIGPTTMVICGLCWLLLAAVIIFEWIRHPRAAAPGFILLMGATSLVVAPFAAAPIALSRNRVR